MAYFGTHFQLFWSPERRFRRHPCHLSYHGHFSVCGAQLLGGSGVVSVCGWCVAAALEMCSCWLIYTRAGVPQIKVELPLTHLRGSCSGDLLHAPLLESELELPEPAEPRHLATETNHHRQCVLSVLTLLPGKWPVINFGIAQKAQPQPQPQRPDSDSILISSPIPIPSPIVVPRIHVRKVNCRWHFE